MENKRYKVIFAIWGKTGDYHKSETCYDTLEDIKEEEKLINEIYGPTPRPCKKFFTKKEIFELEKKGIKLSEDDKIDWSEDAKYWGYVILDFKEEKILRVGGDGIKNIVDPGISKKSIEWLKLLDRFFRREDEVPKGYKWDYGEYEGWLRFRWGDGKNAIGYQEPPKPEKPKPTPEPEPYDQDLDPNYYMPELEEEYIAEELEDRFASEIENELKLRRLGW